VGELGGSGAVMHDFHTSLAKSHAAEDLPIWEQIYKKGFPNYIGMHSHRQDGPHQRAGVDRSVILSGSKQILIDEKVRFRNYGDILLEYLSSREHGTPGWVCKPLLADYIAYAILAAGRCYLLPVIQLQGAWAQNKDSWLATYASVEAKNNGWTTVSCPVPEGPLFRAIGSCLRISFDIPRESKPVQMDLGW